MAQKDYYKVLGVTSTANADDIKKSYRKLAKRYHPDVTGGDKAKEAKFKEISEAYEVLSDPKRREEYDTQKQNPFASQGGFSGFGGFGGFGGAKGRSGRNPDIHMDLNDIFGNSNFADLFEQGFGGTAGGRGKGARRPQRGTDLQTNIELSFVEAALGVEKSLTLEPDTAPRKVALRIPAGANHGETIRVPGQGRAGARGGAVGDLLLQISITPHPQFRRTGADIEVDVPLRVDQAILGGKVEVQTLEGKAMVSVPAGTSSGKKVRLRGKGAGDRKGGRGDLYGVLQIVVPTEISEEAKALIQKFADLTTKG